MTAYRCDITYVWLAQWQPIDVTLHMYGLPKTAYRCDVTYVRPVQVACHPTKFVYFCLNAIPTLTTLVSNYVKFD